MNEERLSRIGVACAWSRLDGGPMLRPRHPFYWYTRSMPSVRRHRKRYEEPGHARFLTFSCYKRLPLFKNDDIKDAFAQQLEECRARLCFRLIAWVVMPDHVHLMLIPALPQHSVSTILEQLKTGFSRMVLRRWRELEAPILSRVVDTRSTPHFWQRGGGYDRNITTPEEFFEKLEYIHANPVRGGLVGTTVDWPWSSARWYAGLRDGPVTIDPFVP